MAKACPRVLGVTKTHDAFRLPFRPPFRLRLRLLLGTDGEADRIDFDGLLNRYKRGRSYRFLQKFGHSERFVFQKGLVHLEDQLDRTEKDLGLLSPVPLGDGGERSL